MLLLLCHAGTDSYVIDGDWIIEIVPRVRLSTIPHAPKYVVGLMNFNGDPLPVIDLCQLIQDRPSDQSLHSRIIVLKDPSLSNSSHAFGLLAEKVTETMDRERGAFLEAGVQMKELPFLGGILQEKDNNIQWILLPELCQFLHGIALK